MANKTSRSWDEHVRRWRNSGLSAKEYAHREGLNAATLYGWSSRLGRVVEPTPAHFIELAPSQPASCGLELRIGAAVSITVERGFDPQLLRDVMKVLVAR